MCFPVAIFPSHVTHTARILRFFVLVRWGGLSMRRAVAVLMLFTGMLACAMTAHALTDEGYKELHLFTKVLHLIEDNYVDPINEKGTVQGAIRGMLRSLDPHSVYMSPEVYRELKVDTSGRFDGVGLEVTVREGWITVIAPIHGSPAEAAGVQTGDQIIAIDGRSTENMDLALAVKLMRGRRGSHVTLTLARPGIKLPFEVDVVRQKINVPSVKSEMVDGGFGYIKIMGFQEDTAKTVRKVLKRLKKQGALSGLIIDVRRNPGGLLEEAVEISDVFLKEGVIVTTESRGKEIERFEAAGDGEEPDVPIIVLVDYGSASASEIVAGALKDNGRAIVVGARTFGKGSVQTVFELGDGSALKLTVARYFTPDGTSIQAEGIAPDIEVILENEDEGADGRRRLREADLSGHLERPGKPRARPVALTALVKRLKQSGVMERNARLAREGKIKDYQKSVAIDFLKLMASGKAIPIGSSLPDDDRDGDRKGNDDD